jgi:hypothetical protein
MHPRLIRCSAAALCASLFGLLAALPASCANARTVPVSRSALASYELSKVFSAQQLEELLAKLPVSVNESPLTPQALAAALTHLPALEGLEVEHLEEALKKGFEKLGTGTTLEEALQNPTALAATVTQTVQGLLSPLELTLLEDLLGQSLSQSLQEALGEVNSGELLQRLLGSGSEGPAKTLEALLQALPKSTVEKLLGSSLGSAPVTEQTVSELAEEVGMTSKELAESAGESTSELPPTAKALTAPLSSKAAVSVLDGTDKAVLDTLSSLAPGVGSGEGSGKEEGSGSGSGAGGSGSGSGGGGSGGSGSGGSSGAGGNGGSSGTTVIVNVPTQSSTGGGAKSSGATTGHVRVIGHRVHGDVATITLAAPGAGTIVLRNGDIKPIAREVAHAGRVSIKVKLSKAGIAAVRRHRRLLLHLGVSFRPSEGASSQAPLALLFK